MYFTKSELDEIINFKINKVLPKFIKSKPRGTFYDFVQRANKWKIINNELYKDDLKFIAKENVNEIIKNFYVSDIGFSTSRNDLFYKLRAAKYNIKVNSCMEFLNNQVSHQIHKKVIPTEKDRIYIPSKPFELFIGDTTVIESFNGYSFTLNLIDAFSKYAWSQPIKIQNAINIKKALEKIFNLIKLEFNIPINLHSI